MPLEQTITIINNSGKIISTGKHLVGIFKEARLAYKEKKEALRQERAGGFRRAHTFNVPHDGRYHGPIVEEFDDGRRYDEDDGDRRHHHRSLEPGRTPLFLEYGRRLSLDSGDRFSHFPSANRHRPRPHRSSTAGDAVSRRDRRPSRPSLTATNLHALTEVSATGSSAGPQAASRGPYAASAPRDLALSRPALHAPARAAHTDARGPSAAAASMPRTSMMVHRPRSDPALSRHTSVSQEGTSSTKPIDMNLAYGSIPPDLKSRVDLDPGASGNEEAEDHPEYQARTLVDRIESLLNEAQCLHHTAASTIRHLQNNPEAAAAVALTLAELSTLLAKLSPAFLGVVKGGSPAVFALLASPQFLIGTGIAVGVTVIIFGGWRIIRRISEVRAAREDEKQAFELDELLRQQANMSGGHPNSARTPGTRAPTLASGGFDEALVLEEELSTIESWRRGIVQLPDGEGGPEPWGGTEVDVELISPEAMRSRIGDEDERTLRSARTRRATNPHGNTSLQSSHSRRLAGSHRDSNRSSKKSRAGASAPDVPERHGSKGFRRSEPNDERSRSGSRHRNESSHGRHGKQGDAPASEAGSLGTGRSSRHSGRSRRDTKRVAQGRESGYSPSVAPSSDAAAAQARDKKTSSGGNMLRQLFKKKRERGGNEREDAVTVSVLA